MTTLRGDEAELQLGDSGEDVVQLQDRLRGLALLDKQPDGSYDDATESAVRQLQSELGHGSDGRVTTDTWQALDDRMLSQGLEYNQYAGAGQQHWDTVQHYGATEQEYGDAQHYGDAEQQYPEPATPDAAYDPHSHQVSEQGYHYWDGAQWQELSDADRAAHAEYAANISTAAEPAVIPHIDDIHPAIRDDERFGAFHDFLRERAGQ